MSDTATALRYAACLCLLDGARKLSGKVGLRLQSFGVDSHQLQDVGRADFARPQQPAAGLGIYMSGKSKRVSSR